jgi:hypothetical protein
MRDETRKIKKGKDIERTKEGMTKKRDMWREK